MTDRAVPIVFVLAWVGCSTPQGSSGTAVWRVFERMLVATPVLGQVDGGPTLRLETSGSMDALVIAFEVACPDGPCDVAGSAREDGSVLAVWNLEATPSGVFLQGTDGIVLEAPVQLTKGITRPGQQVVSELASATWTSTHLSGGLCPDAGGYPEGVFSCETFELSSAPPGDSLEGRYTTNGEFGLVGIEADWTGGAWALADVVVEAP